MNKDYFKIYFFTIIPATILFFSNLEGSKEASIFLLFCGFFLTFLNWKKDSDWRVKDLIEKIF